jgi:hypothetical protein
MLKMDEETRVNENIFPSPKSTSQMNPIEAWLS